MSSRELTRECGSSYLVQFFEDNEHLIVSRSRIFQEGRVNIDDIANIQWGTNQQQSSEGKIIDVGNYCELSKRLKILKSVTEKPKTKLKNVTQNLKTVTEKPKSVTEKAPPKKTTSPKKPRKRKIEESKENTAPKKLKSGKPAAKIVSVQKPQWLEQLEARHNQAALNQVPAETASDPTPAPTAATPNSETASDQTPAPTAATLTAETPSDQTAAPTTTTANADTASHRTPAPTAATPTTETAYHQITASTATTTTAETVSDQTLDSTTAKPLAETALHQTPTPHKSTAVMPTAETAPVHFQASTPLQPSAPIQPPAPLQNQAPHQASVPVQAPAPLQPPAPLQNQVHRQAPAPIPAPLQIPAPHQIPYPQVLPSHTTYLGPATDQVMPAVPTSETVALPLTPTSSWMQILSEDNFENELGSPDPRTETPNRQLFDFEGSLSDIFRSPNVADLRITTALDRKLDAVNKKLALLNRQMKEQTEKMNYVIQLLGTSRPVSEGNMEMWFEAEPLLHQPTQQFIPEESEGITSAAQPACLRPDSVMTHASTTTNGASYLTTHFTAAASTEMTNTKMTTPVSAFPRQPSELNNDEFKDIPVPHRLTVDQLYKGRANSRSLNTFVTRLIIRLYPELFGEDKLRRKYNYYGVRGQKMELERQRKSYFQRYVLYMHPELRDPKAYQDRVVCPVNKYLRRPHISSAELNGIFL